MTAMAQLLIGLAALGVPPAADRAGDLPPGSARELAAEARREFDVLAPSLRRDAAAYLEEIRAAARAREGKPGVHWETEDRKRKPFVRPAPEQPDESAESEQPAEPPPGDGKKTTESGPSENGNEDGDDPFAGEYVPSDFSGEPDWNAIVSSQGERLELAWFNTERVYDLMAVEKRYRYELLGVAKIMRTGRRDEPFEGVVRFKIRHLTRTVRAEAVVPAPIPEGYRRPRPGEIPDEDNLPGNWQVYEEIAPVEKREKLETKESLLPVQPFRGQPLEELPPKARRAAEQLQEKCQRAEQRWVALRYDVSFLYHTDRDTWEASSVSNAQFYPPPSSERPE